MDVFRFQDIIRWDCGLQIADSDGKPVPGAPVKKVTLLFNNNVISSSEVETLIKNGMYERSDQIICVTPEQADMFTKKHPAASIADVIRTLPSDKMAVFLEHIMSAEQPDFNAAIQAAQNARTPTTSQTQSILTALQQKASD